MRDRRWGRGVRPVVVLLLVFALGIHAGPVSAFVILGPVLRDGSGELDVVGTLENAPRWSYARHASIGGAGLDDGLQVAVEPGFAAKLAQRVTGDTDPATVAEVEDAVRAAFAAWESGVLHVNVIFDGPVVRGLDAGAEVDLFSVPDTDPLFFGNFFFGYTPVRWVFVEERLLTNGAVLPGPAITRADIFLNMDQLAGSAALLPRDMQLQFLQRLIMHEFGHALGLGHPNIMRDENIDSDDDPLTPILVDPDDPFAGLFASPVVDQDAILSNKPSLEGAVSILLHADDRSGRDVLYPQPRCPGDCDGNGRVTIDELVRGVGAALGGAVGGCAGLDLDASGAITVDELVRAVLSALQGCVPA